jgi:hypothetical protein
MRMVIWKEHDDEVYYDGDDDDDDECTEYPTKSWDPLQRWQTLLQQQNQDEQPLSLDSVGVDLQHEEYLSEQHLSLHDH